MPTRKWTEAALAHLEEKAEQNWGDLLTWTSGTSPGAGYTSKAAIGVFNRWCEAFATVVGAQSGAAVQTQLQTLIHARRAKAKLGS